ncbi:sensor histidine kinase [Clostridium transplantifaecale]|uniref:sensor histidine kinase n=1 Tax=Clostridium transplantifaecale TaxID=2479838 RepID=UPI001FA9B2D0|nr:HAMP domain-containing sensor histidine kinase [Clostridium transplantifaecale]
MMMKLLRNPEIKVFGGIYLLFSVAASAGAAVWNPFFALYAAGICLTAGLIFLCFTKKRYDRLAELSTELDEILHGEGGISMLPDREGELAVLGSKIYKMTVRLQEQAEELGREKVFLQNSLEDVSHQVKTPLTSIRLLLKRIKEAADEEEKLKAFYNMDRLLTRTEWLIATLLKIARLESGTLEFKSQSESVSELLKRALEPLEIPMELKGQILLEEGTEKSFYKGDLLWSAEAMGNILKNCVEHTPEGGTIMVCADENPVYTRIRIRDNGEGFAEEDLNRLFERFYRGKNIQPGGAGIGLALAGMIIRKQNGTIRAGNAEDGGAEFDIRFYKGAV